MSRETREEMVRFRAKPSEIAEWKVAADELGLPLSAWFRQLAVLASREARARRRAEKEGV